MNRNANFKQSMNGLGESTATTAVDLTSTQTITGNKSFSNPSFNLLFNSTFSAYPSLQWLNGATVFKFGIDAIISNTFFSSIASGFSWAWDVAGVTAMTLSSAGLLSPKALSVTGITTLATATATTPASTDNSTNVATTAFVKGQGYVDNSTAQTIGGNKSFTGTTTFDTSLPTSSIIATPTATQFLTKQNADAIYSASSSSVTLAQVQANNNAFTGTNTFNSSLPTSSIIATPTLTQFLTKQNADALYSGAGTGLTLAQVQANNNAWTATNNFSGSSNIFNGTYDGSHTVGVYSSSTLYAPLFVMGNNGSGITQRYQFCDDGVSGTPTNCVVDWISPANASASNVLKNGWLWKANNNYTTAMSLSKTGALTVTGAGKINSIDINQTASFGVNMGFSCIPTTATGSNNFCMGYQSLYALTSGANNCVMGAFSGIGISTSSNNVAVGSNCLRGGNTANSVGVGGNTLYNSTGNNNTAIGFQVMNGATNGSNNTCIGSSSNISGNPSNCTAIGAGSSCASFNQSTAIGYNATATSNNQVVLGTNVDLVICPNKIKIGNTSSVGGILFGTMSTSASSQVTVTFPVAFTSVPTVVTTVIYGGTAYPTVNTFITATTTSYFTYNFQFQGSPSANFVSVNWIAICA